MNCFNHIDRAAVAQCSDCGKGLCAECTEKYEPILCTPCFQKRRQGEKWRSVCSLLLLAALYAMDVRIYADGGMVGLSLRGKVHSL